MKGIFVFLCLAAFFCSAVSSAYARDCASGRCQPGKAVIEKSIVVVEVTADVVKAPVRLGAAVLEKKPIRHILKAAGKAIVKPLKRLRCR